MARPAKHVAFILASASLAALLLLATADATGAAPPAPAPKGPKAKLEQLRRDRALVLVRTSFAPEDAKASDPATPWIGTGLAWVKPSVLPAVRTPGESLGADLDRAEGLLKGGDLQAALGLLAAVAGRDPMDARFRRLYASALRRSFRFEPALFLTEAIIAAQTGPTAGGAPGAAKEADPELLREAAELAVLVGDKKTAESAIKRLRKFPDKDKEAKKARERLADDLTAQLSGGAGVAFAGDALPHRDRKKLVRDRTIYDRTHAGNKLAAEAYDKLAELLAQYNTAMLSGGRVDVAADESVATDFRAGGDAELMRQSVSTTRAVLTVDKTQWTLLWDHEKNEQLHGICAVLRSAFPNAAIIAYVCPTPEAGGQPDALQSMATIKELKGTVASIILSTPDRIDPFRMEALRKEIRDAEDARKRIKPGG